MQSRFIALAVLAVLAPAAWGQAARVDGTEAEAAMERAKRAAAGPLKAIQQAARIRRRGETEPASPAAVIAASVATAPVSAAAAAPDRAAERTELPVGDGLRQLGARVATVAEMTTVAPLAPETVAPATVGSLPSTGELTPPLLDVLPALAAQPRLLETVEPSIPLGLLEQAPRGAEVEAELSLRADGSVAGVRLLPPVPRAWQRYIVAALERWRYEPMSSPGMHRVRLVFGSPGQR